MVQTENAQREREDEEYFIKIQTHGAMNVLCN